MQCSTYRAGAVIVVKDWLRQWKLADGTAVALLHC